MKDVTPELLAEMKDLHTGAEVKDFLAERDFEISDKGAEIIAAQLSEGETELTKEQLDAISGGCGGGGNYGGTK